MVGKQFAHARHGAQLMRNSSLRRAPNGVWRAGDSLDDRRGAANGAAHAAPPGQRAGSAQGPRTGAAGVGRKQGRGAAQVREAHRDDGRAGQPV